MSLHKLTAGDGYTYLIRQVAATDSTERGTGSLESYYSAKGESPGVWMGGGLESLGTAGEVTEQQMKNLFGEGIHPDAERVLAEKMPTIPTTGDRREIARAMSRAVYLGRPFQVREASTEWPERLGRAYREWNVAHGTGQRAPIDEDVKAGIRTQVATEMFTELHGRPPASGHELSGFVAQQSRQRTTAVAGFDHAFSPVKSVSALWAVAPVDVAQKIEKVHRAAVADSLAWLEKAAGYTREGTNGIAQVEIRGLIAAVFEHRDSRAGDPDLHTHVAVSNKVQTLGGKWLALDARMLHRMAVTASERYNTLIEAGLIDELGVRFADREAVPGKRPVREIVGVPAELNSAWSSRRRSIEEVTGELQARFLADHGRVPTAVERIALAQQATLATRQAKHEPRSLAEQRQLWHEQAAAVLGGEAQLTRMLDDLAVAAADAPSFVAVDRELLAELTAATVATVADTRAQWRSHNLEAEAVRQARAAGIDPNQVVDVATQIVARAVTAEHCLPIGMDPEPAAPIPAELRRSDGQSVFRMAGNQLYTSSAVMDAERRLITAGGRTDGRTVTATDVEIAELEWSANNGGAVLNTSQRDMVTELATNPRRLQLALAPAGTGKTTVMGVLAAAWQSAGGTILGLAPQASAAQELAAAIPGVDADTLDKLTYEVTRRNTQIWPQWIRDIGEQTLVVVDEAGLASTPKLDIAVRFILGRGGRVILVGDDQQRAANGAGGILRNLEATHGAVTLTEVMRFTDPQLGRASLALRAGDRGVVGFYADRDEIHAATPDTVAGQVYKAWAADIAGGADSIMVAPTLAQVSALNALARAGRITSGQVTGSELALPNGDKVAAGDVIVTKRNERRLSMGGTDFVRNNYRWTVGKVHDDGSITATDTRRGVTRTLPAWYVAAGHVRLGYAYTHASVQGLTVGKAGRRRGTAHVIVTPDMTRNDLYPALTRAADGTDAYVVTPGSGDRHDVVTPGAVLPPTPVETMLQVLARTSTPMSVTSTLTDAADPLLRLGPAADAYHHALVTAAETAAGPELLAELEQTAAQRVPGVTAAPAWPTLRAHLALLRLAGRDPAAVLDRAAGERDLAGAVDPAAVLDFRIDPTGTHSMGAGPLPWLPAAPLRLAGRGDWARYLDARAGLVDQLADDVRVAAAGWTVDTAPSWVLPYLGDPVLVADLAVWRAAQSVPVDDPRPAGPRSPVLALGRRHRDLSARCIDAVGNPADGADRWAGMLADHGVDVVADDYWPVLAARLSLADAAGLPVTRLLDQALNDRAPLPVEAAAGALWWRLAPHLGADVVAAPSAGHHLRPVWTAAVVDVLGEQAVDRLVADRLWPTIVAAVDRYQRTTGEHTAAGPAAGARPAAQLVADAARTLRVDTAAGTVRPHEAATVLLWSLSTLTDPEPVDVDNRDVPFDPADADLLPPADVDALLASLPEIAYGLTPPPLEGPDMAEDPFDAAHYADLARQVTEAFTGPYDIEPEPDDDAGWDEDPELAAPDGADQILAAVDLAATPIADAAAEVSAEPVDDDPDDTAVDPDLLAPTEPTGAAHDHALARAQAALDAAAQFWSDQRTGSWVPDYIDGRGLDSARFGYAPAGWTTTRDHLAGQGFTDDELAAAGLVRLSSRGTYIDQFRDRAMVAITQPDGRIAGFIGRKPPTDGDERNPKYLNSPATELFSKGRLVYGLDEANIAALRAGAALAIVEGPMDAEAVNAAHQGIGVVAVAPSGTALTADQLALIDSVAPLADRDVIVAFDQDQAGRTATLAAGRLLRDAGVDRAEILENLDGKDPSEMLQNQGRVGVAIAFTQRRPLADLVIDDAIAKSTFGKVWEVAPTIADLPVDQRWRQAGRVAEAMDADPFTVLDQVKAQVRLRDPDAADRPAPEVGNDLGLPTPPPSLSRRSAIAAEQTGGADHAPATGVTAVADTAVVDQDIEIVPAALAVATDEPAAGTGGPVVDVELDPIAVAYAAQDLDVTVVDAGPDVDGRQDDAPVVDADVVERTVDRAGTELPDLVLAETIDQLDTERRREQKVHEGATTRLSELAETVPQDRGPAMLHLQRQAHAHQERLSQLAAYDAAAATIRAAVTESAATGVELAAAEREQAAARGRHARTAAEHVARLTELQSQQHARLTALGQENAPLQQAVGTKERRAATRAAAERYREQLPQLVDAAREQDREALAGSRHWVASTKTRIDGLDAAHAAHTAEQQHRSQHPDPAAEQARQQQHAAQLQRAVEEQLATEQYNRDLYYERQAASQDFGIER